MDPAHDAYDLASTFLDSRVYDQLRERQRNAYGLEASKLLTPAGVLTLQSTRVEPTHAGDALKGLIEALNTATDGALHQRYAANTRARGLVAEMDKLQRTKSLARTAIELHTHGLPADYFQRRVRAVNRFSMSQMTHAFRTYFRRKKIQIVLVGRADRLAPIAERVQSGAVTVADGAALARSLNR